jgi:hypothetical protein
MKNFLFLILPFLLLSCAGSKVEIKPENLQSKEKQDTTLTLNEPRKLFTEPTYETDADTITIPKRTKQPQSQQIILVPIVIPIMAVPFQSVAEKPKETTQETKPETPKPKEEKPEQIKPEPIISEQKVPMTIETKTDKIPESKNYFIQVGAFITENSAVEQLKKFKSLYPTLNAYAVFDSTLGFYKVLTDGLTDSKEANKILQTVAQSFPDAFITSRKLQNSQPRKPPVVDSLIKLQIGAYSKYENAVKVKGYVETKFKISAKIKKTDKIFKVFAILNRKDIETINEIKSEFTDAFEIK